MYFQPHFCRNKKMAILKTVIRIPSLDGATYNVPADLQPAQVQSMYAAQIPGVGNMTSTVTVSELADGSGQQREIVFTPRSGNKGTD